MKLETALKIIKAKTDRKSGKLGFMVSFERVNGSVLASDHFPDTHDGEKLIPTEQKAWDLARKFADSTNATEYVNIYVIDDKFCPVSGYREKKIRPY